MILPTLKHCLPGLFPRQILSARKLGVLSLVAALGGALVSVSAAYDPSWSNTGASGRPATWLNFGQAASVPIEVTAAELPARITLNFPRPGAYQIFRKDPAATGLAGWGTALVTLPAGSKTWTDTTVSVGQMYEYKAVVTDAPTIANDLPTGYTLAGIKVDHAQPKGRMVVVVATDIQEKLPAEFAQYLADLEADGWFVHVIPWAPKDYFTNGVDGPDADAYPDSGFYTDHIQIRNQIMALYNLHPGEVKNVALIGKVPLARTGTSIGPDGHGNRAAVGADGYYANMVGTWADVLSNTPGPPYTTVANGTINIPGDYKFDPNYMYQTGGKADLGFGRIDLSNAISGEYEAMRVYFNKLHRYKVASPDFLPGRKIAIRTNGFATNDETGWMCGPNISGMSNVEVFTVRDNLESGYGYDEARSAETGPYLFYFKGNGPPQIGVGGKAVFWTGMQSHWGWWFEPGENTMAQRLAEDSFTLSFTWNIYSHRYFYHRMGMGMDAGDMMRVSINNNQRGTARTFAFSSEDGANYGAPPLFMNHMGDPALRLFMFAPPTDLGVVPSGGGALLSWTASPEPTVIGYHVYRADSATAPYQRLTSSPVVGTTFSDASVNSGFRKYMVRAVRLETTGSGTFYNTSLGAMQVIDLTTGATPLIVPTAVLPDANWNVFYQKALRVQGGYGPYAWSLVSGVLPPGLSLSAGGELSGIPGTAGVYEFDVQAEDKVGVVAQGTMTLTVSANALQEILAEVDNYVTNAAGSTTVSRGLEESMVLSGAATKYEPYLRFNLSSLNANNSFVRARLRLFVGPGLSADFYGMIQAALTVDGPGSEGDGWYEGSSAPKTVTGLANNGSGKFRVTCPGHGMTSFNARTVNLGGFSGTGSGSVNGARAVAVIDENTFDLPAVTYSAVITWSGAYAISNYAQFYESRPADNMAVEPVRTTTTAATGQFIELDVTRLVRETLANDPLKRLGLHLTTAVTQKIEISSKQSFGDAQPRLIVETTDGPAIEFTSPVNGEAGIYEGSSILLHATVTPIPARAGSLTMQWSKVSGPGTVSFDSPSQPTTGASFSAAGNYVVRLMADDGVLPTTRNLIVRVYPSMAGPSPSLGPVDGLVLRLPLDEGTGTTANDYAGVSPANNGTLAGGIAWTPSGKIGGALQGDGAGNKWVLVPDSATNLLDGMQKMSISFWFHLDGTNTSAVALLSKRTSASAGQSYTLSLTSGAGPRINFDTVKFASGASTRLSSSTVLAINQWYHVVAIFDGSLPESDRLQLFLNGNSDKRMSTAAVPGMDMIYRNATSGFYAGGYPGTGGINGKMDEVRFYNRALTIPEIQDLYAAQPTNLGPVITLAETASGNAGQPFALNAALTDDGRPTSPVTLTWRKLSGPGTVIFANDAAASTTATASLGGIYTLRLTATDGDITTFSDVIVSIAGGSLTYSQWAASYGLPGDGTGQGAPDATPAKDGIPNSMKFALGIDPRSPGYQGHYTAGAYTDAGQTYLAVTYVRPEPAPTGVVYEVQTCGDLGNWTTLQTVEVSNTANVPSAGLNTVVVRDSLPMASPTAKRFIRLHVRLP